MNEKLWKVTPHKKWEPFSIGCDISFDGMVLPVIQYHIEREPFPMGPAHMVIVVKVPMADIELIEQKDVVTDAIKSEKKDTVEQIKELMDTLTVEEAMKVYEYMKEKYISEWFF